MVVRELERGDAYSVYSKLADACTQAPEYSRHAVPILRTTHGHSSGQVMTK